MSTAGGEPTHVTITLDYETLIKELAVATLDYGQRLSATQARLAACDCKIIPVVMNGMGKPLDVGRAQRTVPLGIRRALVARDRGCRFPGLRPPASIVSRPPRPGMAAPWSHRDKQLHPIMLNPPPLAHAIGWDITIRGNLVEFRPPAILDFHRKPLNNPLRN
jgi:hypothetical protein